MTIGSKLKYVRKFRQETMQSLGEKLGFPENQADSRIAQYESGNKKPRENMLISIADKLDIHPDYLMEHFEDTNGGFMRCLYEFERLYGAKIDLDEENISIKFNREAIKGKGIDLWMMQMLLLEKAVEEGKISQHDYDEWKLQWPNFNHFGIDATILADKLENNDTSLDLETEIKGKIR